MQSESHNTKLQFTKLFEKVSDVEVALKLQSAALFLNADDDCCDDCW